MNVAELAERCVWDMRPIEVIGISEEIAGDALYILENAVSMKRVKIFSQRCTEAVQTVQFDYLGMRYEVEMDRVPVRPGTLFVRSLERIARVDEPDEFSDAYGDHFPIVVEDYRLARQPQEFGSW